MILQLRNNKTTIIDDDDFDKIKNFYWYENDGYIKACLPRKLSDTNKKKILYLHRIILGAKENELVDHKNHDTTDNRKENLRICDKRLNTANAKNFRKNKSGACGVSIYYLKNGTPRYKSNIYRTENEINTNTYLGIFNTLKEAADAYDKEASKRYGEFAKLNNII